MIGILHQLLKIIFSLYYTIPTNIFIFMYSFLEHHSKFREKKFHPNIACSASIQMEQVFYLEIPEFYYIHFFITFGFQPFFDTDVDVCERFLWTGFGYADLRQGLPVKPSSLFRIGSVSKPITASAVFLLVDRGLLDIDNPVFGEGKLFG